jgi:hypothetical protein
MMKPPIIELVLWPFNVPRGKIMAMKRRPIDLAACIKTGGRRFYYTSAVII